MDLEHLVPPAMSPDLEYIVTPGSKAVPIKIALVNPTSYATANPHIQLIAVRHADLQAMIGTTLNYTQVPYYFYFIDLNTGQRLYAYYDYYINGYHIWFVKTAQIPGNSYYKIYMVYDPSQTWLDGVYNGVNPVYASNVLGLSYGQYDNGSKVFYYYWNFAGTSLPSGWTQYLNGGSISVNNGLTMTTSSSASGSLGLVYNLPSTAPSIGLAARTWYNINQCCGCSGGNDFVVQLGNSMSVPWSGNGYAGSIYGAGGGTMYIIKVSSGSTTVLTSTSESCGSATSIYRSFVWTYLNQSYLWHYESRVNILLSATDTTYTPSAIQQLLLGIMMPNSGTTSYTVNVLQVFDAPLSYSVTSGIENFTPTPYIEPP